MLMTKDGNRVPMRLILFSFIVAIVAPIAFPNLSFVPIWKPLPGWATGWIGITLHGVIGAIVGAMAGFAAGRLPGPFLNVSRVLNGSFHYVLP